MEEKDEQQAKSCTQPSREKQIETGEGGKKNRISLQRKCYWPQTAEEDLEKMQKGASSAIRLVEQMCGSLTDITLSKATCHIWEFSKGRAMSL